MCSTGRSCMPPLELGTDRAADRQVARAPGLSYALPGRPVADIADDDPVFHTVFDLDRRYRISGSALARDPPSPRGRLMVAIRFNNDTGDSLEWADAPEYPERDSALDVRMPANQAVYAVTH